MSVTSRSAGAARWRSCCRALCALLALAMLSLPGCGGCSKANKVDESKAAKEKEKKKKEEEAKKEKPKLDFERLELAIEPSEPKNPLKAIKPGHWMAASIQTRANNFDFSGELDTAATDSRGNLLDLERTPFRLATSRSAVLPKGQTRRMEVSLFVPSGGMRSWVTTHLRDRGSGREARRETEVFNHMPAYQYFLLGLVGEPDRYRWLKVINSVRPPTDGMVSNAVENIFYRVQLPSIGQSAPLPSESLCWTSVAYVVWDDIDPSVLNIEQQQAMLDWLHWGGQLIISGPKTLDQVKHSFLEPYLPATAGSPRKFEDQALAELNEGWTIAGLGSRPLAATHPWSGIELVARPQAEFLPSTGGLVVERRVGRGRIVATAFRLVERDLINWPSFDSFVNGCLLRRPHRTYIGTDIEVQRLDWADKPANRLDPERICQLRYFARDTTLANHPRSPRPTRVADPEDADEDPFADPAAQNNPYYQNRYGGYYQPDPYAAEEHLQQAAMGESGVAGWNDFGPVASAARTSLKQAAGITIPHRDFVLKVLLGYLVVLVPLNWLVFRLIGRIEWAWIAAPLIAIVCAGVVIWLAQLDIGFARSSTEIAIVELQGDYPRAHVAHYTALYTSLSTTYAVHLEQPSALALPMSTNPQFEMLSGQQRTTVNFRRDSGAHLTGFGVSSNATGMIHSEHMVELPGAISLADDGQDPPRVANATGMALRDAGVVRRLADGEGSEIAWIGELKSGESATLVFEPADEDLLAQHRERSPQTAHDRPPDTLSLRSLVDLAENPERLGRGDVRLVALFDEAVPGERIEPAAAQERHATLVVVNLRLGPTAPPRPDTNLPRQNRPAGQQYDEADDTPLDAPLGPGEME